MKPQLLSPKLSNLASAILLPCALLGLVSCDGGSGSDSDTVAPQSVDGLILDIQTFQGPSLTFIAGRGQEDDGTEEGVIQPYLKADTEGFIFPGANFDDEFFFFFNGAAVKWPDEFTSGRYRYTPVGNAGGRLEVFGVQQETRLTRVTIDNSLFFTSFVSADNFLGAVDTSDPLVFDLSFRSPSGGFISGVDMIMTTPRVATVDFFDDFEDQFEEQELTLIGDLTFIGGGRVNTGYDVTYDGNSRIFDGELGNSQITLVDDVTGTRSIYIFTTAPGSGRISSDVSDSGNVTLTYDIASAPGDPNAFNAGTYEVTNDEGTDIFFIDFEYDDTLGLGLSSPEIVDGVVTLNFTNGRFTRPIFDTQNNILTTVSGIFSLEEIR